MSTDSNTDGIDDALFTDEARVLPTFNVLRMSIEEAAMIPDEARGALKWRAGTSAGVVSLADLKRRMTEYIELHSLEHTSVRPITLNRRFNRIATKLGSSCSTVIDQLQAAGLIISIEFHGKRVWFSQRMLNCVKTNQTSLGTIGGVSETTRIAEYIEELVDRTV